LVPDIPGPHYRPDIFEKTITIGQDNTGYTISMKHSGNLRDTIFRVEIMLKAPQVCYEIKTLIRERQSFAIGHKNVILFKIRRSRTYYPIRNIDTISQKIVLSRNRHEIPLTTCHIKKAIYFRNR